MDRTVEFGHIILSCPHWHPSLPQGSRTTAGTPKLLWTLLGSIFLIISQIVYFNKVGGSPNSRSRPWNNQPPSLAASRRTSGTESFNASLENLRKTPESKRRCHNWVLIFSATIYFEGINVNVVFLVLCITEAPAAKAGLFSGMALSNSTRRKCHSDWSVHARRVQQTSS